MAKAGPQLFAVALFVVIGGATFLDDRSASAATGPRCYVDKSAGAPGTGNSWGTAYTDLQSALTDASCTEVWVAAGVYKPTATADRTISFEVKPGVAVYGGFAGGETSLDQRSPAANVTVLSGDIDGNDNVNADGVDETVDTTHNVGNSYRVVYMYGVTTPITTSTVLDGFTITAGNADTGPSYNSGGGLYCNGEVSPGECSPALSNLVFSGNSAVLGGALFNDGYYGTSSPTLTDVTFSANHAYNGGAVMNYGDYYGESSPSLTRVTFRGNDADGAGGAVFNYGSDDTECGECGGTASPTLTNVTFGDNNAGDGGAIHNEGTNGGTSSPTLTNVTFSTNSAGQGGAIYSNGANGTSSASLTNVILWGDTAGTGPEVLNYGGATTTTAYSVVQGGCGAISGANCGSGNLSTDPLLGPVQNNGGLTQTMELLSGSSAIDTGDDTACPVTDQRLVTRPQDGDMNGSAICDIGAYEVAGFLPVTVIPALSFKGLALLGLLLAAGALGLLRRGAGA
ncbi:MAG TPA: choice-of-anchor Q domain-containing protein [Thermoanaerobaculia bacterium]|nr:choice-of-anchor Q domain-containing protein [Thermoanaerobaculia bacterium]